MSESSTLPADRLVFVVAPRSWGCEACCGLGKAITDELDEDGLWFQTEACPSCFGTAQTHCAADGCERVATYDADGVGCCGNVACATQLFERWLRGRQHG